MATEMSCRTIDMNTVARRYTPRDGVGGTDRQTDKQTNVHIHTHTPTPICTQRERQTPSTREKPRWEKSTKQRKKPDPVFLACVCVLLATTRFYLEQKFSFWNIEMTTGKRSIRVLFVHHTNAGSYVQQEIECSTERHLPRCSRDTAATRRKTTHKTLCGRPSDRCSLNPFSA